MGDRISVSGILLFGLFFDYSENTVLRKHYSKSITMSPRHLQCEPTFRPYNLELYVISIIQMLNDGSRPRKLQYYYILFTDPFLHPSSKESLAVRNQHLSKCQARDRPLQHLRTRSRHGHAQR